MVFGEFQGTTQHRKFPIDGGIFPPLLLSIGDIPQLKMVLISSSSLKIKGLSDKERNNPIPSTPLESPDVDIASVYLEESRRVQVDAQHP
jgi:hypothetical protein